MIGQFSGWYFTVWPTKFKLFLVAKMPLVKYMIDIYVWEWKAGDNDIN